MILISLNMKRSLFLLTSIVTRGNALIVPQSVTQKRVPVWRMVNQQKENIMIEDRSGHINPILAQKMYRWEQEQRQNLNLPKLQYSTRQGLRWVLDLVTHITQSSRMTLNEDRYEDLVQEGIIELMQAMTNYEKHARPQQSFETYAKHCIQLALEDYLWEVKTATTGTQTNKPALSMESTVEIADPLETHFKNQEEWEVREGLKEPVQDFVDKNDEYEGDDQMWIHQQQIAAPLRDMIPDGKEDSILNNSPDDLALMDMIRYNVDEVLSSTLEDVELQVIQMRFGLELEDLAAKTQKEVAYELGLSFSKIRKLQRQALEKLRTAYAEKYVDNDDNDDYWQDSV